MNSQSIRRLRLALGSFQPYRRTLVATELQPAPKAGQFWLTGWPTRLAVTGQAPNQGDEPVPVIILRAKAGMLGDCHVHTVVPVLPEIEMAGPEDVVLPREILGYRAIAAFGATLSVLGDSLSECRGMLPPAMALRLRRFHEFLLGFREKKPPVETGLAYLDERDIRYTFHAALPERLAYLLGPVTAALEDARAVPEVGRIMPIAWAWSEEQVTALAAHAVSRERTLKSVEYAIPVIQARLRISECMERGRLAIEVLRDPGKRLEGAAIVDSKGRHLATIRQLCAGLRCPRNNRLALRDASGRPLPMEPRREKASH